jgi:UDP-N-acetyl-D-mannosaminuronate dehydrogenase
MKFNTISIIGLGYIGLPAAALLASRGINVIGVDINSEVVDIINQGKIHIIEPELDALVYAVVANGKLRATTKLSLLMLLSLQFLLLSKIIIVLICHIFKLQHKC